MAGGSYIVITEHENPGKKTRLWEVTSTSGSKLGIVSFWPAWRCYVFVPATSTVFNSDCLGDIKAFLFQRTEEWRREVAARRS